jgi:hypothetical protein
MWFVEGVYSWGVYRYEMLTREQSREIHSKMSNWQSISVQSGIME